MGLVRTNNGKKLGGLTKPGPVKRIQWLSEFAVSFNARIKIRIDRVCASIDIFMIVWNGVVQHKIKRRILQKNQCLCDYFWRYVDLMQ